MNPNIIIPVAALLVALLMLCLQPRLDRLDGR